MKHPLFILCAIFALAACGVAQETAAGNEAPDVAKLALPELVAALEKGTAGTVAEAIRRLPTADSQDSGSDTPQTRLFVAACGAASEAELPILRGLLRDMLLKNPSASYGLSAYASAELRAQVAKAKREGRKFTPPAPTAKMPDPIANGDPELRQLWVAWHTARDPYNTMLEAAQAAPAGKRPEKNPTSEQVNEVLRKALADPTPDLTAEIAALLQPEPLLTTNREAMLFPGSRAMLLQTMRSGPTPETIGASFNLIPGRLGLDTSAKPGTMREAICDLLTLAGLDWEEVVAGGMISDALPGAPVGLVRRVSISLDDMTTWQALASRGSPRGVRLGLSVIRKTKMDSTRSMDFIRTALRTTPVDPQITSNRLRDVRPLPYRTEPLPPELRDEVLAVAQEFLALDRPASELTQTLRIFPRELLPAVAEPLKKLLRHPSYPIALQTRNLLVTAKLAEATAEITPPPAPLRVRVTVDDKPMAITRVQAGTTYNGAALVTDADGWLKISLEQELDPTKLRTVQIVSEISEVTNPNGEWEGPWVELSVPVNGQTSQEFTANVETASLEVALDPTSDVPLAKPARLILTRTRDIPWRQQSRLGLPIKDSLTFQHLQRGTYYLEVIAEGAARYQSKPIVLGKNGSIRLVRLEPGRNVRVKFESSDSVLHLGRSRLFRNGEAFTVQPNADYSGWDGLPFGKYELRLDPWPMKGQVFFGLQGVPEGGYEGITKEFELRADSPSSVDLGSFPLKSAK